MGFNDLALVSPVDTKVLHRHKAVQRASGAKDVLQNAKIYNTLEEAVYDSNIICGTGMPFDMYKKRQPREYVEPRVFFDGLLQSKIYIEDSKQTIEESKQQQIRLSLVFGAEDSGMQESDMDQCNIMLGIPTNPSFGSLNLASAVQLIAYDWRMALGGHDSYA